jgi:hypothetical protein
MTPCRFGGIYRLHLQGRRKPATCLLAGFLNLFLQLWRWRRYVPPKRQLKLNGLHGVISQKIILFIATAVKTSNPTCLYLFVSSGSKITGHETDDQGCFTSCDIFVLFVSTFRPLLGPTQSPIQRVNLLISQEVKRPEDWLPCNDWIKNAWCYVHCPYTPSTRGKETT